MNDPLVWHIGGADVHLRIPLLLRVRDAGFRVGAVGTSSPRGFAEAGIAFHECPLEPGLAPLADARTRRRLIALIRDHRPAIVHAFDTKPCLLVPAAVQRSREVRCVRTITGMGRLFADSGLRTRLLRAVYRAAHRHVAPACAMTVFQNEDDRRYFLQHALLRGRPETLILGSGVDLEGVRKAVPRPEAVQALRAGLGAGPGESVVLMIARLVASKGIREFQRAAAAVRTEHKVRFVLAGPVDAADPSAQALASELARDPNVVSLGWRDDVPALLAAADVFVLPTYYREGLPRVLLEAAILDVPLVATAVPGCREVVIDGVTGLVVRERDAADLARAIGQLLSDGDLRRRLAAAAHRHVADNFSLDRVARSYVDIYRRLAAG